MAPASSSFVEDLVLKADHSLDHIRSTATRQIRAETGQLEANHEELRESIRKLSTSKRGSTLHSHDTVRLRLQEAPSASAESDNVLEWILVGKATSQTCGVVLDSLLSQISPLNAEIQYWTSVLNSVRYTAFYSLQTAPFRLWAFSCTVYQDAHANHQNLSQASWNDYYEIVRSTARRLSPVDATLMIRQEIEAKLAHLQRTKSLYAASIALLLIHGFDTSHLSARHTPISSDAAAQPWRKHIANAVQVLDAIFDIPAGSKDWRGPLEQANSTLTTTSQLSPLRTLRQSLLQTLTSSLPAHSRATTQILAQSGRPSLLTRYWLPAAALFFSSSTLLRVVLARRAALAAWAADAATTTLAFWQNWVLAPATNLVKTIRHDDAQDVSLMSRASLETDRASLERMVVSFATDHPSGPPPSETQLDAVRAAVREGDLTPVLLAYEADLKAPLAGTLRGNLVRALLIQIQKTKVDIQIALRGIDSLIQSQQLVFGLLSLTPGLLVTISAARSLATLVSRPADTRTAPRLLHAIDNVLASPPAADGTLGFEAFGLLVVEAVQLRELARRALPKDQFADFTRYFSRLVDFGAGIDAQQRELDRIWRAFGRYFNV